MIKVDIYNYEAFYLDYLEGNLNAKDSQVLLSFLDTHPACAAEVVDMADVLEFELPKENLEFEGKEALLEPVFKNGIDKDNVENWLIGSAEGLLSEVENQKLINYTKAHGLEHTSSLYRKIKLQPDLTVVYENKNTLLKKKGLVLGMFVRMLSVAAVLALVFFAVNWNMYQNVPQKYASRSLDENNFQQIKFADEQHKGAAVIEKLMQVPAQENIATKPKTTNKKGLKTTRILKIERLNPVPKLDNNYLAYITMEKPLPELSNYDVLFTEDDLAFTEIKNTEDFIEHDHYAHTASKVNVHDRYKPVTNALSNFTKLPVSYQESTKDSDYKVTKFKIGKISFERKKKK
ncbi:hypothetical protein DNU06_10295 [Putridiphycobacter roseus]|uniref:Uncharacterized protein n=1 Tax=Putridiphycobacter roseus TaxID=2219161 RepID=A0A2W1N089_9FLAO|nr:hypothetical protein [Putridiphycobacter roseus]PZE17124.1 hypothetical protein DNU06_10295 [Putridiphycobacter roseus]